MTQDDASSATAPGKVYLVGSGPGDPGLLTCRARELFESCDVICHDKLISPAILALAPSCTPLLATGYRGYHGTDIDYGMHPLVIEQALSGKNVLRLKSGDPFIFGRATEECADLQKNGIAFEVVPGITAALGASAYAGFPLTSGGIASDITIASGHQSSRTMTSWAAMGASTGTLVLYMGAKKLAQHAQRLIQEGRDPETPVAHISSATSAKQKITSGTLATIGNKVLALNNSAPALVVMGDVVALREQMDWRAALPLSGKQVLLAGETNNRSALAKQLRNAGAIVTSAPKVAIQFVWDEASWKSVETATALHFLDPQAVASWWHQLKVNKVDLRKRDWRICAENKAVEDALHELGLFDLDEPSSSAITLGGDAEASLRCWQEAVVPFPYKLDSPDIAIIESVAAADALLDQQHAVLASAAMVVTQNEDVWKALTERGYSVQKFSPIEIADLVT